MLIGEKEEGDAASERRSSVGNASIPAWNAFMLKPCVGTCLMAASSKMDLNTLKTWTICRHSRDIDLVSRHQISPEITLMGGVAACR